MKDIINMLSLIDYGQANETIRIAKGRYEMPLVTIKRLFNKLKFKYDGR